MLILSGGSVFVNGRFTDCDIFIQDGVIVSISPKTDYSHLKDAVVYDLHNCLILPGLVDVHVHLRVPGYFYKEDMHSGTLAAAHGGYTDICAMPNLNPVPDSVQHLDEELSLIKSDAMVRVHPYGAVTVGEMGERLSDMDGMNGNVVAFSDDGRGVQSDDMMKAAMIKAKSLDKIIAAHCEVNELLHGGYIHDGEYAKSNGHKGICSASEYEQIARDIELARQTGCKYHVCHISTKESVELIRKAKADGVDITCETGPHYLILCDEDLQEDGRFKMNPPLRSKEDRQALIEGIKDGTIDMIATDHAPHSAEEKSKGLQGSAFGIVGLETAFSLMYTHLVKTGIISLEKLAEIMHTNPSKRFNIGGELEVGNLADLCVFKLDEEYTVNSADFLSKGKATPFEGEKVYGKCIMTMVNGRTVWNSLKTTPQK